jgi:tetratricopeptide (TPR) repeat protein
MKIFQRRNFFLFIIVCSFFSLGFRYKLHTNVFPSLKKQTIFLLNAHAYQLALNNLKSPIPNSKDQISKQSFLELLGDAEFKNQHYETAHSIYKKLLRWYPISLKYKSIQLKSIISLIYLKFYQKALNQINELQLKFHSEKLNQVLMLWKGECYFQLDKINHAKIIYNKILNLNPHNQYINMIQYLKAWCNFKEKNYHLALQEFKKVFRKTKNKHLKKLSLFQIAETLYWETHYNHSLKTYQKFNNLYPNDFLIPATLYGEGWCLEKENRYIDAIKAFQKLIMNYPTNNLASWAAAREGAIYSLLYKKSQAITAYHICLRLALNHPPADVAYYGLGWVYYNAAQYFKAAREFSQVLTIIPRSSLYLDAIYLEAGCLYLNKNYSNAQKVYQQIVLQNAGILSQASQFWIGWCQYALQHYQNAKKIFDTLSSSSSNEIKWKALLASGACSYQISNYQQSISTYVLAKKSHLIKINSEADNGLGWCWFQLGNYLNAIKYFHQELNYLLTPNQKAEAILRLGDSYYNLQRYHTSIKYYTKIALIKNVNLSYKLESIEQLGWCQYRLGNYTQCLNIWTSLLSYLQLKNQHPLLRYWIAWVYFREKHFREAAKAFQRITQEFPNNPLALEAQLKAADSLFNAGKYQQSIQVYKKFINMHSNNELVSNAFYGLQWAYERLGDISNANQAAEIFLKKFPSSNFAAQIEFQLADSLYHQKQYLNSIQKYKNLIKTYPLFPEISQAYFWLGTAYYKLGHSGKAIKAFKIILKNYPQSPFIPETRFSIATIYFALKNYSKALKEYHVVFSQYPHHRLASNAMYNSAICEEEIRNLKLAIQYFQQVSQNYPKTKLAAEALLQAGAILENHNEYYPALAIYAQGKKVKEVKLAVEASYWHAYILKQLKRYQESIQEFKNLLNKYPTQGLWCVSAMAQIAECYESLQQYSLAANYYKKIIHYTNIASFQKAAQLRLKALQPFLHAEKMRNTK